MHIFSAPVSKTNVVCYVNWVRKLHKGNQTAKPSNKWALMDLAAPQPCIVYLIWWIEMKYDKSYFFERSFHFMPFQHSCINAELLIYSNQKPLNKSSLLLTLKCCYASVNYNRNIYLIYTDLYMFLHKLLGTFIQKCGSFMSACTDNSVCSDKKEGKFNLASWCPLLSHITLTGIHITSINNKVL